jgi:hypothetical protein
LWAIHGILHLLAQGLIDNLCFASKIWGMDDANEKFINLLSFQGVGFTKKNWQPQSIRHRQTAGIETIESSNLSRQTRKGSGNTSQKFK